MLMPPVSRYMTAKPITIAGTATLGEARRIMQEHQIRHLPVVDGEGRLAGIVSERDLHVIETLGSVELGGLRVEDAMAEEPFVVSGDAALDEVVEVMGERKYGCVVVTDKRGIAGIFTAVDACTALAGLLRRAAA